MVDAPRGEACSSSSRGRGQGECLFMTWQRSKDLSPQQESTGLLPVRWCGSLTPENVTGQYKEIEFKGAGGKDNQEWPHPYTWTNRGNLVTFHKDPRPRLCVQTHVPYPDIPLEVTVQVTSDLFPFGMEVSDSSAALGTDSSEGPGTSQVADSFQAPWSSYFSSFWGNLRSLVVLGLVSGISVGCSGDRKVTESLYLPAGDYTGCSGSQYNPSLSWGEFFKHKKHALCWHTSVNKNTWLESES